MVFSASSSSSKLFCVIWVFFLIGRSDAQASANTTDLTEVQALNTTLNSWGISALTTQNPCNDNSFSPTDWQFECNCNSTDGFCHITELAVTAGVSASGTISEQLGNLQFLTSLDISMNNFIGTLPPVLGNLTSLQILHLNSLGPGINGEIPSSFANLTNLQSLWISDNNFTGNLPVFFGDLTELRDLRIQGNSFEGPIPITYRNLINLDNLQIGELLSVTEGLDFITGISSLKTLILRNTRISGIIPNQTSWTNLKELDLSFNNISGTIPESLFELPVLNHLFLGSNNLTGFLPNQKNSNLTTIDVSYNELSGTIPSWVQDGTLNLNFIANNFNISTADMNNNNGNLPRHLDCLQRNVSCKMGTPNQSDFAVNSGSSLEVIGTDAMYEIDNSTLGPANYYVQDERWGVSNVGRYIDGSDTNYIQNIGSRFPNSQSSQLFQAARISPSSLRYYGIGLENGAYDVELQFGETDNWQPNGLRLFDIFIQENLVEKNFNIYREAGNRTLRAVTKNYVINVTNNFLNIHFFWAGKGTCCLPTNGTYGPLISAVKVSINGGNQAGSNSDSTNVVGLIAGLTVAAFVLASLLLVGLFLWRKRRRANSFSEDEALQEMSTRLKSYTYSELKNATNDFNEKNLLGQGGFGPVYKGVDSDGMEIAVKKLSVESVQGKKQFITEISTISTIQHRNLVRLHGCCYEGNKRLLVYEYMPNRSLDKALFEKNNTTLHLDWPTRFKILIGTARGLMYLHEESAVRIVHRDVKASNILLDVDLNPKVSDFGLAKLRDDTKSHISTGVAGTVGYLAPEYAMRGQLTEKADVFGFGVVALEVIYGRQNTDHSLGMEKTYLLEWAWHNREEKREFEMIDPKLLSTDFDRDAVSRVIGIAILCTQTSPTRRPTMSKVVAMLVGDLEVPEVLNKPSYLMDFRYTEGEGSSVEYTLSVPSEKYNHVLKSSAETSALFEIDEGR